MSRPFIILNQSDSLIQVVDLNSDTKCQTVQIQISWLLQKPTDLDQHCKGRIYLGSAGQGLMKKKNDNQNVKGYILSETILTNIQNICCLKF